MVKFLAVEAALHRNAFQVPAGIGAATQGFNLVGKGGR